MFLGVVGELVLPADFKSVGGRVPSAVGSIPTYSRQIF